MTDPEDQKHLGNFAKGFIVGYSASKGVCQGPCESITLTQAWTFGRGLWRYGPEFDYEDEPINGGRTYPIFDRPSPDIPISMIDRPFHESFSCNRWQMTVCAICTTRLVDASGRRVIVIEQVLGCITFKWQDLKGDPTLIHGGRKYKHPSSANGIPAVLPAYPWGDALKKRKNTSG